MASTLPATLVAQVDQCLQSTKPVNQKVDEVCNLLGKHGFAQKMSNVLPSQVLVHPQNRANTMVSYHDVWDKGLKLLQVGMKRSLLGESIAVELSTDPTKRQKQIHKNQALVDEANGHLAPLQGDERFLSLYDLIDFHLLKPLINRLEVSFL